MNNGCRPCCTWVRRKCEVVLKAVQLYLKRSDRISPGHFNMAEFGRSVLCGGWDLGTRSADALHQQKPMRQGNTAASYHGHNFSFSPAKGVFGAGHLPRLQAASLTPQGLGVDLPAAMDGDRQVIRFHPSLSECLLKGTLQPNFGLHTVYSTYGRDQHGAPTF